MANLYIHEFPKKKERINDGKHCHNCDHWVQCHESAHMGVCVTHSEEDWDVFTEQNDCCELWEEE